MRALCLGLLLLAMPRAVSAQDSPRPVAVWVRGYGPLLPSEWRERVLPAARRSLANAHPEWRLIDADEVARLEAEADRQARPEGGATLGDLVAEAHPGATTFALTAQCGDDDCTLTGESPDLEVGALWELPFSLRPRAWVRVLSTPPGDERMGFGRGVGGRGLYLQRARGRWGDADREALGRRVRAIAWPADCVVDRVAVVDLVVEVRRDGTFGEVGATSGSRFLSRCLERGLHAALATERVGRARRPRRLELIAIGRP